MLARVRFVGSGCSLALARHSLAIAFCSLALARFFCSVNPLVLARARFFGERICSRATLLASGNWGRERKCSLEQPWLVLWVLRGVLWFGAIWGGGFWWTGQSGECACKALILFRSICNIKYYAICSDLRAQRRGVRALSRVASLGPSLLAHSLPQGSIGELTPFN